MILSDLNLEAKVISCIGNLEIARNQKENSKIGKTGRNIFSANGTNVISCP
jgi:hypothetical protein